MTEVNGAAVVADLDKMISRIAELERREALLTAVATQARRYLTATQRGDNIADMSRRDLVTALNAVDGPFTYDPDAPLKLA